MATIVTGGTGFVGSNIVRELARRGHQVVSVDIVEPDDMVLRYLVPWSDQVAWVQGDILDRGALLRVAEAHDIRKIVHAAVYTAVREVIERADSRRIVDINLAGTANMLDLAKDLSVERFLYVSSGGVYEGTDSADERLGEDVPVHPRQLYNVTKYASELITHRYGVLHGFETVCVRLGGPYGPMERVTGHRAVMSMMHQWTGKAVRGEAIEAEAEGGWDFTYVADIAAGIRAVLDAPALPHRVYNLSRGIPVSSGELVAAFRLAHPSANIVEPTPGGPGAAETSTRRRVMDPTRIQEDLGFVARHDLVSGLREYIKWRRDYGYTD